MTETVSRKRSSGFSNFLEKFLREKSKPFRKNPIGVCGFLREEIALEVFLENVRRRLNPARKILKRRFFPSNT